MIERPPAIRQSLIASFDRCPLATRFELESERRQPSWLAARGTLAHRFFAEALSWMRDNQERQIPVDVAMELLVEVVAQRDVDDEDVVHLPMSELRWLRILATKFAYQHSYSVENVVSIEERLYAKIPVVGRDGEVYERTISGQLDVLLADPPDGAKVVDYKTGWAPPARKTVRDPTNENEEDRLSDMGYAQQVVYGYLVMANYPSVDRVSLREFYVLSDETREATIERWEMERIADVLSAIVAQFDAAVDAHPRLLERQARARELGQPVPQGRWLAVAGSHCGFCPRPRDCPIRDEVGIPADERDAQRLAGEWIKAGEVRKERLPYLKGWVDRHGPIEVRHSKGRRMVGWAKNQTGDGRAFRLYEPEGADPSPFDPLLAAAAREAGVLRREEAV